MRPPRIKVCCIGSVAEARTAVAYGASAIGLVGHMPSGPGVISDKLIHKIAATVPPPVATFLLTSETSSEQIIRHHKITRTNTIQLVDKLSDGSYHRLKKTMPAIKIVQVIHIIDESSVDAAIAVSGQVDAILLDSGNPNLKIKQLGGTGRVHNWRLSRRITEALTKPVFLAGGLDAGNVRRALEEVQPFGLDICSGVRTDGRLDRQKLESFFEAVLR